MPLTLLATTHRVAPGLLTWPAWDRLRGARVLTGSADHPQLPYLREAGVDAEVLPAGDVREVARALLAAAEVLPVEVLPAGAPADPRPVVWLAAPEGDEDLLRAVGELVVGLADPPEVEVLHGSYDLPGARLLDLVVTMDALRDGCPWDAKQTHESLAPYLLEESYEALEAVETGDRDALCEELGDVLLQVVFHARVAEERADETRFTIDDVAAGIVDKLVRRHPHVFGSTEVRDAEEVKANWDSIKAAERAEKRARGRSDELDDADPGSVLDGVPFGQPALALASALQKRASRAGAPADLFDDDDHGGAERPSEVAGQLFALVARARELGLDPEAELRAAARGYRDRVHRWERGRDSEPGGADPVAG